MRLTAAVLNQITKWVVIGPLLLWAVWEVALLWFRTKLGPEVRLISQEGKRLAFNGFVSLAYFTMGLAAHINVTWHRPTWEGTTANVLGAFWWAVGVAYFVGDMLDPKAQHWPEWAQWLRYPPVVALLGAILAVLCFPQRSNWVPWRL